METQPESSQRCGEVAPSGISIEEEPGAAARTLEGGSHGFPVLSVSFHFPRSGGEGGGPSPTDAGVSDPSTEERGPGALQQYGQGGCPGPSPPRSQFPWTPLPFPSLSAPVPRYL